MEGTQEKVVARGWCPFCDVPLWHICEHFVGYIRNGWITGADPIRKGHRVPMNRPIGKDEVAVDTGVSVRAYRRGT